MPESVADTQLQELAMTMRCLGAGWEILLLNVGGIVL